MYHKINDEPENSVTVPVSLFDEQLAQLGELGYTAVSLDDVLAYYVDGVPLPDGAVLITFDDGYRDNLENAVPVLEKYGYPAVLFVPIGYLDGSRPLPHDEHLASRGILNRTLQWSDLADLDAVGRARRVAWHRAPAARRSRSGRGGARDHALEAAARGGARPPRARVRVREGLGGALPARPPEPARSRPATRSRSRPSRARTGRRPTRSSSTATTSSRTRRGRSSSCSPAPATSSGSRTRWPARTRGGGSTPPSAPARSERLRARLVRAGASGGLSAAAARGVGRGRDVGRRVRLVVRRQPGRLSALGGSPRWTRRRRRRALALPRRARRRGGAWRAPPCTR